MSELFCLPKNPEVAVLAINTAQKKMGERKKRRNNLAFDLMTPIRKKRKRERKSEQKIIVNKKIIWRKWIQNEKWVNTLVYLSLKAFAHIMPFGDIKWERTKLGDSSRVDNSWNANMTMTIYLFGCMCLCHSMPKVLIFDEMQQYKTDNFLSSMGKWNVCNVHYQHSQNSM